MVEPLAESALSTANEEVGNPDPWGCQTVAQDSNHEPDKIFKARKLLILKFAEVVKA